MIYNQKMVKIQDGSVVPASEIFDGSAQDDEGQPLKFKEVKDAQYPRWEARSKMTDGSNRLRTYSVSLIDVNLVVRMAMSEEGPGQEGRGPPEGKGQENKPGSEPEPNQDLPKPQTEKVTKEVTPESKKNSSNPNHDLVKKRV